MSTKVDLEQLAKEIRVLNRHHKLYRLLKLELGKRGWWKNRERGNPSKGYKISKHLL
jgi:hypothetical protein